MIYGIGTDIIQILGHAIVAHAVFVGWQAAVSEMKALMVKARLAHSAKSN